MTRHRAFVCACLFGSLLACSSDDSQSAAAGAGSTAGSSGSGAGAGDAGASATGGSAGTAGGGAGTTGGASGTTGGTSGAAGVGASAGTAGGTSGTGGSGGGEQLDCHALGEGCVELCEGGVCSCDCSSTVSCPLELPTAGAECESSTEICFYEERTSCNSLWECYKGHWMMLERGACLSSDDALCPFTPEAYMAGGCLPPGCVYDGVVCGCASPACSGVFQEPRPMCTSVVPAVCRDTLVENAPCSPLGTRCGTMCCGVGWECTETGWKSTHYPCPP